MLHCLRSEKDTTLIATSWVLFFLGIKMFILRHTLWFLPPNVGLVYAWIVSLLFWRVQWLLRQFLCPKMLVNVYSCKCYQKCKIIIKCSYVLGHLRYLKRLTLLERLVMLPSYIYFRWGRYKMRWGETIWILFQFVKAAKFSSSRTSWSARETFGNKKKTGQISPVLTIWNKIFTFPYMT